MSGCAAVAIGACGEGQKSPSAVAPSGMSCQNVMVPGHKAVDVKASGVACSAAEKVAAAAEGRGRTAYKSGGFACKPSEASRGDTNYSCSMGPAKVTFLYGSA